MTCLLSPTRHERFEFRGEDGRRADEQAARFAAGIVVDAFELASGVVLEGCVPAVERMGDKLGKLVPDALPGFVARLGPTLTR